MQTPVTNITTGRTFLVSSTPAGTVAFETTTARENQYDFGRGADHAQACVYMLTSQTLSRPDVEYVRIYLS